MTFWLNIIRRNIVLQLSIVWLTQSGIIREHIYVSHHINHVISYLSRILYLLSKSKCFQYTWIMLCYTIHHWCADSAKCKFAYVLEIEDRIEYSMVYIHECMKAVVHFCYMHTIFNIPDYTYLVFLRNLLFIFMHFTWPNRVRNWIHST